MTHPYLARVWAKAGADLRVPAPGQAKKVAMMGSLDHVTRQLIVHTSPTKRSRDFVAHLEQLDRLHGPKPGQCAKPVVLVLDNGPIHTSKLSLAALAARAALAHRRVAAQICAGTERHRTRLARPQGPSSRPSDLRRRRCARPRNPPSCWRTERRTYGASVGQATNLCHENSLSCTGFTWPEPWVRE